MVELKKESIPPGGDDGKNDATISLVLGIVGICLGVGIIVGPIGLYYASLSQKKGCDNGIRTAGYITSLIALIAGIAIVVILIIAVVILFFLGFFVYVVAASPGAPGV